MATRANKRDGGEAVVEAIRNLGIKNLIMSPGSEWSPVWEALTRQRYENIPGPNYMQIWHENLAVNIATGYTFMTGEPQAVLLHAGVGPLQGIMGMHAAMQSEVPMLVMAGESITLGADLDLKVEPQWYGGVSPGGIDKLVSNSVKWSALVPSAPTLYRSITRAGEMALRGPKGPVFLDVPIEYMLEDWVPDRELSEVPPPSQTQAITAELEQLVAEINAGVLKADPAAIDAALEAGGHMRRVTLLFNQYRLSLQNGVIEGVNLGNVIVLGTNAEEWFFGILDVGRNFGWNIS